MRSGKCLAPEPSTTYPGLQIGIDGFCRIPMSYHDRYGGVILDEIESGRQTDALVGCRSLSKSLGNER